MKRVYNFSAGPSALPLEVLQEVQRDMLDYADTGMSITEMSHRSKAFEAVNDEIEASLRELLNVPDNYYILFVQGGASQQFAAVPLNLLGKNNKADYVLTGNFSTKSYEEASRFGDIHVAASSKDENFTYIPRKFDIRPDAQYLHICTNNTIFGTRYNFLPKTDVPIVADMSSEILSRVINVSDYAVIYAGAQKNVAPAGVTIVIARKDLVDDKDNQLSCCPTMLKWATQVKEHSLYNTPPAFSTYVSMLVFRHLKKLGGVGEMQKVNEYKAKMLYDYIDNSSFYTNSVVPKYRSLMNVPFVPPSPETDAEFVSEAAKEGLLSLKGHRLVGGMRASIYNAMPVEGVQKLVDFMKQFETEN